MVFLTALCTTIGAAILSDRIGRAFPEIAVGCLSVALLALVVTLVSAPWEIQLALVVAAVVSYRSLNRVSG
ncbi:hypothetical protein [Leptolyngbya ohadii]|uniref:hypothetical protein n=1 Tax=Leptolyngbya ohadii TaxID=1962290 RepID=UPI000B59D0C9|nr:hypothetical protein [Leptolyngbya ohadii]